MISFQIMIDILSQSLLLLWILVSSLVLSYYFVTKHSVTHHNVIFMCEAIIARVAAMALGIWCCYPHKHYYCSCRLFNLWWTFVCPHKNTSQKQLTSLQAWKWRSIFKRNYIFTQYFDIIFHNKLGC
jgi:hypothetical protein